MKFISKNSIAFILLFVCLFLFLLQLPNVIVTNEHDLGSQASYEYWLVNGFQYGLDFSQNVGPFGFLNYPLIYSGFLFNTKVFLNIFLVLTLLFLVPKYDYKIFLAIILSLSLNNKQDVFIYILLHISFIHILQPSTKYKLVLSLFVAALLCLSKSTCLFVTFWGVIVLIVKSNLYKERYITKVIIFLLFLVSLWLLAGQSLVGFIYHLKGAILFSNGYNDAMAVQEPVYVTLSATFVVVYYFSLLSKRLAYNSARKKDVILDSMFFIFLLFAVWKHGMVRADAGHISIFFAYAIFAIISQRIIIDSEDIDNTFHDTIVSVAFPVVLLLSSFFLFKASDVAIDQYISHNYSIMRQNLYFLINFHETKDTLERQLINFKNKISLPNFKEITRTKKVGYLGVKPAVMLYNDFNYQTNPSTISFASWNHSTMLADSVFFAGKVDFLIVELETIDQRYLPLDNSLSKLEVLKGFSFVSSKNSYVLLKKKESKKALTFLHDESEFPYILGSWRTIPNTNDLTWVKINLMSNFVETILSIPYKPMSYQIEFNFGNGKVKSYRYIPPLGKQGFLLSPEILNNKDLISYLTNSSVNKERPLEFRIICNGPSFLCKDKGIVQFSNVVGL